MMNNSAANNSESSSFGSSIPVGMPPIPSSHSPLPPLPPTDSTLDSDRQWKPSIGRRIVTFLFITCTLLGVGWYYGDKTGYLYEYLPFIKKSWQASPKQVETEEEALFIEAIQDGGDRRPCNLDALRKSLLPIKNVNLEYGDRTPLIIAIVRNDIEAVKLLLQCKADPNLRTIADPLSLAIESENTDMVHFLLEAGANVSGYSQDEKPPLFRCIDLDLVDGIKTLLAHHTDPNKRMIVEKNHEEMPILFYLLVKKPKHHKEIFSLLLERGVDATATYTARNKNNESFTYDVITWALDMDISPEMLLWMVPKVLKGGADPKYTIPETGVTALHRAIVKNQNDLAQLLVEAGADSNACDEKIGITPFHLAILSRNVQLTKLMLAHGADPNKKAVFLAAGETEEVSPLCRLFFSIKEMGIDEQMIETTRLLLKGGADPNISNKNGLSPLLALVVVNDGLAEKEKLQCLDLLLQYNVDVTSPSSLGLTPFQGAIDKNEFLVAKALLDAGADIHQKTAVLNDSLLNVACLNKNEKAVEFLIAHGANVNENGKGGKSPLWCAFPDKRSELNASLACIDLLLKAGADKTNPVVLEEARKSPYQEIRQLFIDEKDKEKKNDLSSPEKVQKQAILQDISSGNLDAGRKSIENIKAALKNAEESETVLLKDLSSVITDLYSIRKMEEAVRKQNTRDEKKITSLVVWERSCMTPSRLTGDTNPSGAARARRDAQLLSNTIRQRNETLTEKQKEIADIAKRIEEQLRKNGREKDADMLKKSTRYFLKINGVSTRDPFDSI